MIYYLTSKLEPNLMYNKVKKVIEIYIYNHPYVGFQKGMIHMVIFLLSHSSEETTYYLF